jgi:biopolymer transport protein TolR
MAISLQASGGRRGRYRPLSEINVTPLVDVMLVLLIIFMVTAPLMTSGVPVDLPKTNAQPLNSDSEPLTVSVNGEGKIFLQDSEVDVSGLVAKLKAIAQDKTDRRIFVRGDKTIPYGRIMEVMGTITQGGFTKVALLAEQTAGGTTTPAPPLLPSAEPAAPAAPGTGNAPATGQGSRAAPPPGAAVSGDRKPGRS